MLHGVVPDAAPQNVEGKALSENSIIVTWQPPPEKSHNGVLTGFRIRWQDAASDTGDDAKLRSVDARTRNLTLRDLHTWTQYKITVAALTGVGEGPKSDVILVQTNEDGMSPKVKSRRD